MRWQSQICRDLSDKSKKSGKEKLFLPLMMQLSGKNFFYILFLVVSSSVLHFVFFSLLFTWILAKYREGKYWILSNLGTQPHRGLSLIFIFFSQGKCASMLNPCPTEVSGKIPNAFLPWEQDLAWQGWTVAKPTTSHPWRSSQGSSNQNNSFAVLSLWCMTAEKEDLWKLWQTYTSAFRKGEKNLLLENLPIFPL